MNAKWVLHICPSLIRGLLFVHVFTFSLILLEGIFGFVFVSSLKEFEHIGMSFPADVVFFLVECL